MSGLGGAASVQSTEQAIWANFSLALPKLLPLDASAGRHRIYPATGAERDLLTAVHNRGA